MSRELPSLTPPGLLLLLLNGYIFFKRIIVDKRADLSDFSFRWKMRVFVSRPVKIVTFLRKNRETAKRVVPRERDTFRNKIMEIVEDFDEKRYNKNGEPWKSSRTFACESKCLQFSFFFHHFSPFTRFFFIFFVGCSKSDIFWAPTS